MIELSQNKCENQNFVKIKANFEILDLRLFPSTYNTIISDYTLQTHISFNPESIKILGSGF